MTKRDKIKFADVVRVIESNGGICLSCEKDYKNSLSRIYIRCGKGHEWRTKSYNIVCSNRWCRLCSRDKLKIGINKAIEIAKKNGGKCLSDEYVSSKEKLKWKCKYGHIWHARFSSVYNQKTWCPFCKKDRTEKTCMLKYGASHHFKNKNIIDKINKTNIKKYGCFRPAQNKDVAKKIARSSNNSYIIRHWKTDEEIICQGSWEFKVVEYLNNNKINFRWQHKVFDMPDGKTYRPDLYLFSTKKWVEIKGYFRKDAKEKWEWFKTIKKNSELWDREALIKMEVLK